MERYLISFILKEILGFAMLFLGAWHWLTLKSEVILLLFDVVALGVIAYGMLDLTTAGGWKA